MRGTLLVLSLALAACGAPDTANYKTDSQRPQSTHSNQLVPISRNLVKQSFGYASRKKEVPVILRDTVLYMTIANVQGHTFAILRQKGITFSLAHTFKGPPDLSTEAAMAAQNQSGCLATNSWRQTYSNNDFPMYSVHLDCRNRS